MLIIRLDWLTVPSLAELIPALPAGAVLLALVVLLLLLSILGSPSTSQDYR